MRRALAGRSAWLLVLETFGVNVWCAAGKGTFGTAELVRRIGKTKLAGVVAHRRLLMPILGATGVAAHEVKRRTGFTVCYASIRASDLPDFLDNSMETTPAMRALTFTFRERLVLVPVELVHALKPTTIAGVAIFLLFSVLKGPAAGTTALIAYLGAVLTGIAVAPALLPWIPGRSFAIKGALTGIAWSACFYFLAEGVNWNLPVTIALFLALPAVSAFYTLNFTGCTPFTSRSGVKKEMRIAIPAMVCALVAGVLMLLAAILL